MKNTTKALVNDYTSKLNNELESYVRMKVLTKNVLDSEKPFYYDIKQLLTNLWQKEQLIMTLTGTIYTPL